MKNQALVKLMHLVSPALPVGAYAYSQGQEYAVDSGWLKKPEDVKEWMKGVLIHSMGRLDIPMLIRFYQAWEENDLTKVEYWNNYLRASRETHELLLEDDQLGSALNRLLASLEFDEVKLKSCEKPTFASMFSLAGVEWHIPQEELLHGFVWSWLENQVAAATKIVPLGQTQAQKMLVELSEYIEAAIEQAKHIQDDEMGAGLPALAIASSLHERQYSRLFRS